MAKQKKPSITISDVKTFRELAYIQSIVNTMYDGEMPVDIYKGFLNAISNTELKAYFIRNFKPKSYVLNPPVILHKKKMNKSKSIESTSAPIRESSSPQITSKNYYQSVYTVRATDFSFVKTLTGPHLVFRTHKAFCFAESQWFQPRFLRNIDRTFQIRISDYTGFSFIPHSDKQVFLNLLKQAFLDVEQQIYHEELNACLNSIEKYLNRCVDAYIHNCQNLKFETNLDDYSFNEDKQVFIYKFNALSYLGIKNNQVRLHVPLARIMEQLDEDDRNKFHKEITSKYPDGYITVVKLDCIFPNITSMDITVVIPKIFIARFGNDKPIEIKAEYSSDLGYFKVGISSDIPGYPYQTGTSSGIVFSDEIKDSLIDIMHNIDSRFIITFYSAFVRMFNEGDSIIQSNYEKQLESLKPPKIYYEIDYDYYWHRTWVECNRYNSGYSPLLPFDTDNTSDWMWLTTQMKNGVFLNAYAFKDKDETLSSKNGETVKYPVKVYLTVKNESYTYKNYIGQSIHIEKVIISMYALDTAKSIYRFEVKSDKINEAIFFIWSYFSSNNYNKRQDFEYILGLKSYFGIINFYKDSPLDYRSGIGYCDRKWLTDI